MIGSGVDIAMPEDLFRATAERIDAEGESVRAAAGAIKGAAEACRDAVPSVALGLDLALTGAGLDHIQASAPDAGAMEEIRERLGRPGAEVPGI